MALEVENRPNFDPAVGVSSRRIAEMFISGVRLSRWVEREVLVYQPPTGTPLFAFTGTSLERHLKEEFPRTSMRFMVISVPEVRMLPIPFLNIWIEGADTNKVIEQAIKSMNGSPLLDKS